MPLKKFNNILIIRTDRIGDVVLTTPVFKALRRFNPSAKITVLVSPPTKELVEGNPYLDAVMVDDRQGMHKGCLGLLRLASQIRLQNFDAVIVFHSKRRYHLAVFLAGIPVRIGFESFGKFGFLLTWAMRDTRHLGQMHEVDYCFELLSKIGVKEQGHDLFVPILKEAEMFIKSWFESNHLQGHAVIAIHPGASDMTKTWPSENFAKLAERLTSEGSYKVVVIGAANCQPAAMEISRVNPSSIINACGQLSLSQTVSLLRRCQLLVSNDSGPVHIADALGIHVISLFLRNQPGINATRWAPRGIRAHVLCNKKGEEIILDHKGKVVGGDFNSITVEDVWGLINKIFMRHNQSLFYW